ncbi:acyltransferase [Hydrogenophilus thiooxidans]|uniref:acyltransferase n=1 Tax=Hydrogenophilus thiooxidans TaxID=2820326 RepID=UPI001C236211|nr:hypothetical protein [Hydrogenophilus thiooxidans]
MRFSHPRIRTAVAKLIAHLPFNSLRCWGYRLCLGYTIEQATIGWGTVIAVDQAKLIRCAIGSRNRFIGPMHIEIGEHASIGPNNTFECGWWTAARETTYERRLRIEPHTLITSHHFFDIAGVFRLGAHSWIAGRGSQFWAHGLGVRDRNITIGRHCYIGSAVRFAPGSAVGDFTIVGLGSIVTRKFTETHVLIAGNPATVLKSLSETHFSHPALQPSNT